MSVSVLLPTTGRPDRAVRCIKQLRETAKVEVVAAVDDDPITAQRLRGLVDVLIYSPTLRGNSAAWNDCLRESTGDPVVFAADDLVWRPGWLEAAMAKLREFPGCWGLVGFNDGHWNGDTDLSTHYLMSRRFIVEVLGGVVAWPWYQHSFNDLEVNERARAAGRYAWAEDAHVYHDHWIFGDRPKDDTDTRTLGQHPEAEAKFKERKAAGFPNEGIEPVISC